MTWSDDMSAVCVCVFVCNKNVKIKYIWADRLCACACAWAAVQWMEMWPTKRNRINIRCVHNWTNHSVTKQLMCRVHISFCHHLSLHTRLWKILLMWNAKWTVCVECSIRIHFAWINNNIFVEIVLMHVLIARFEIFQIKQISAWKI